MTLNEISEAVITLAVGLVGGAGGARWLLERRQAKAAGQVAEGTIEGQIDAVSIANINAQLRLMSAAWVEERTSLSNRITTLSAALAAKESEVVELRSSVFRLEADVAQLKAQLMESR